MIESIWYDEGILGKKIGVQHIPLFKFLLSGDAKVNICVDAIENIQYKTSPIFGPKMPCNAYDYECK